MKYNITKEEKIMKIKTVSIIATLLLFIASSPVMAQDNITIVAPSSEAAEGLDLQAVSELFTETKNLEAFEQALNDPNEGLNNLDLDGNGEVDFIRVVEEVAEDTHLIILQAAIGKDEFQDIATIEVEKSGDNYNMQIHGNEVIYGVNYYYAPPAHIHIHTWPIISWIYRPVYRPYHSSFHFGFYPRWWKPFHPVHRTVYRNKIVRFTSRNTFVVRKTSRVRTIGIVKYKPRTSTRVTKRVTVNRKVNKNGKTTTVKTKKTVKRKNVKTTVKKKTTKTTKRKNGKKKTVIKTKVTKKKRN